jgi:hypothetical protein
MARARSRRGRAAASHEEETGGAEDQEVDLQRAALVGDELEVGPGPVGVGVGQVVADVGEPGPLVGIARWRDLDPAVAVSTHQYCRTSSSPPRTVA